MLQVSNSEVRQSIKDFELRQLFNALGWDNFSDQQYITVMDSDGDERYYKLDAVAEKRGMTVFTVVAGHDESLPDSVTRKKIERELTKLYAEHFVVYATDDKSEQVWQWVKRESGKPAMVREQRFSDGNPTENLVQRIQGIAFSMDEEDELDAFDVFGRVQANFDVERVTKRFYESFKKEHDAFLKFIEGLEEADDREWYASIMLNRLMFIYFVQRKGFLDGNQDYLRHKMRQMQSEDIDGNFLTFYRRFLLKLFHDGLGTAEDERDAEVDRLIGRIPYLNGGLFEVHELEDANPDLDIPDGAFERVFDFFDRYDWHLDERPLRATNEINPDVLGYIFEKYINQKQMGAYYTQEDVTGYITQNTVVPYLFDATEKECHIAFEPGSALWNLLVENPDRYIYDAMLKGVDEPLPDEVAAGVGDVSKRGGWNRAADDGYALPTETWREHVARRQRCNELRAKLVGSEVQSVDDLVTLNLNVRQFAADAVLSCEGADFLRAIYKAVREISVLDPTCGSGAFLFAALNILEPLYDACLERMQQFVEEDRTGARYSDFRENLAEVAGHSSRRYFILKSIMVRNLYGVDIMEEAVEIARLRLFLKLMAQLGDTTQIEPLPDLDFNLRMLTRLQYVNSFYHSKLNRIPQVGEELSIGVMRKLDKNTRVIQDYYTGRRTGHIMHYHRSPRYWIRAMDFEPHFKSATRSRSVHHFRDLYFTDPAVAKVAGAVLNSSLFFFWFVSMGNGRNITGTDVEQFPLGVPSAAMLEKLPAIFDQLMADYRDNSIIRVRQDSEFQEFRPSLSKPIINEIDGTLAEHYDFTDKELDFIINYDIKYRMGVEED